jgi:hypothetical protein
VFFLWHPSLWSCLFGFYSVLSFFLRVAGLRGSGGCRCWVLLVGFVFILLFAVRGLQECSVIFSFILSLTPPRTASGQNGSFQIKQSPNVAAMRWRGWLGLSLLRACSLSSCCLSVCSCRFSLTFVPLFLLWTPSLCSCRFGFSSVPWFFVVAVGLRGCNCCRCGAPWWGVIVFFYVALQELPVVCSRLRFASVFPHFLSLPILFLQLGFPWGPYSPYLQ